MQKALVRLAALEKSLGAPPLMLEAVALPLYRVALAFADVGNWRAADDVLVALYEGNFRPIELYEPLLKTRACVGAYRAGAVVADAYQAAYPGKLRGGESAYFGAVHYMHVGRTKEAKALVVSCTTSSDVKAHLAVDPTMQGIVSTKLT